MTSKTAEPAGGGALAESLAVAVLNPGGRDPDQRFERAAEPGAGHPPVNYHAYAACTGGSFHCDAATILPEQKAVLLLLRRDLKRALRLLPALQAQGKRVAVSLKESGSHQVAALLDDAGRLVLFRELCARADFCLSSTPDLVPFYLGAGARRAEFVPTPYPVESPAWDFSRPPGERRGILIGTREFGVPTRNHLAALLALRPLGEPLTVFNPDGGKGRKKLAALGIETLQIVEGRLGYEAYLERMAMHRLVFQLDRSAVPGQVAGDALLCRVPCVGGDGAVERIAFPGLCGFGETTAGLVEKAALLMRDDAACAQAVADSQRLAREQLSFGAVARRLAEAFGR